MGPGSVRRLETRVAKMCIYTSESPCAWWSQIMTGDSNQLFLEAIHSGIDIFVETGEMRVVWRAQGPQVFFVSQVEHPLHPGRGFQ